MCRRGNTTTDPWGQLGSNQRPADYESGLNAMPLTCTNALSPQQGLHAVVDLIGPRWTRKDGRTWNKWNISAFAKRHTPSSTRLTQEPNLVANQRPASLDLWHVPLFERGDDTEGGGEKDCGHSRNRSIDLHRIRC